MRKLPQMKLLKLSEKPLELPDACCGNSLGAEKLPQAAAIGTENTGCVNSAKAVDEVMT
jgi:hypothetical protein